MRIQAPNKARCILWSGLNSISSSSPFILIQAHSSDRHPGHANIKLLCHGTCCCYLYQPSELILIPKSSILKTLRDFSPMLKIPVVSDNNIMLTFFVSHWSQVVIEFNTSTTINNMILKTGFLGGTFFALGYIPL